MVAEQPSNVPSQDGRRVRILCATSDPYPPVRADVFDILSTGLRDRGYRTDWALWRHMPGPGGIVETDGVVYVLGARASQGRTQPGLLKWLAFGWRFARQARRGNYAILQVRDLPRFGVFVLVLARLLGVRFTYWMTRPLEGTGGHTPMGAALLYRVVLRAADHVFVRSERMCAEIIARGIEAKKITPVPAALDADRLPPAERIERDPFIGRQAIVCVGGLSEARQPQFLIDVLAHVRAVVPEAVLVFIGDAPEELLERLRHRAESKCMSAGILFTGRLPRGQTLALVRWAKVCVSVLPPHPLNDGASRLSVLEYLALGRPVVVNAQADQARVARDSGSALCVPLTVDAFGAALVTLLKEPAQALAMGARGPDYVRRFRSPVILAARVDAAYRMIIKT